MKLHSSSLSRSSGFFHNNRNKLRWMEWLIAVLFIVSLLIGSGIFIKASNAANLKIESHTGLSYGEISTIPGSMRLLTDKPDEQAAQSSAVIYVESDDSCELKVKS
jgi:hypothetical protein